MAILLANCHKQAQSIIRIISKCLILAISCNISTFMLMAVFIASVSLGRTPLQITIHRCVLALDTFVTMFAVYSQFEFGEWLYFAICKHTHEKIQARWIKKIQHARSTENFGVRSRITALTPASETEIVVATP